VKISLVMPTLSRVSELERFLEHLARQTYQDFELIVIDQNEDSRLFGVIERYGRKLPIVHVSSKRGLSRGRNQGLRYVSGDIVAFPDDDCWYESPDLLERIAKQFTREASLDGVTGRVVDQEGEDIYLRWSAVPCEVSRFNLWRTCISVTIFLRLRAVASVGAFDESLGVGAETPWPAGEEMDYMLRVLEKDHRVRYDPSLTVKHPRPSSRFDNEAIARAYASSRAGGRVLRSHRYPWWFVARNWTRALLASTLALSRGNVGKARTRWACFTGELRGWFSVAHRAWHRQ
jgi:glycosyltransferase involved in cell wall biosynthesis